ncbi:MAG: hypothetical protein C0597_10260 [Marinilabiliales bacterium]|nr:MAG: hypothetical protein C0597_10260 [Marinilabiliales bacterium]
MPNDSLHNDITISKGEYFVKSDQPNFSIGKVIKGILRGFTINNDGEEVITHFFMENDLISGNYIPNIPAIMSIQAIEDCIISVANYKHIFSYVNKDNEITNIILSNFQKLNNQNHSRISALIHGDTMSKYKWFLKEYPNLLNRIPHYYIANFLGMTPTQLSRIRKKFSQQM